MCKGPFHLATGHYESEKRHWCGACARSMYKFLKEQLSRRVHKYRFYDYATVPPPAKVDKYRFFLKQITPELDNPKSFKVGYVDSSGVTVEEAYLSVADKIKERGLFCWMLMSE